VPILALMWFVISCLFSNVDTRAFDTCKWSNQLTNLVVCLNQVRIAAVVVGISNEPTTQISAALSQLRPDFTSASAAAVNWCGQSCQFPLSSASLTEFDKTDWRIHCTFVTRSSAIADGPLDASCQLKSCQLPRNSAETTCTTSPEEIKVMKLEGYSGPMCNKHVHSTMTRSSRFHCPVGVINKPTCTGELWISPVYRRLAVAKFSKSTM